jgi:hypothetical protein
MVVFLRCFKADLPCSNWIKILVETKNTTIWRDWVSPKKKRIVKRSFTFIWFELIGRIVLIILFHISSIITTIEKWASDIYKSFIINYSQQYLHLFDIFAFYIHLLFFFKCRTFAIMRTLPFSLFLKARNYRNISPWSFHHQTWSFISMPLNLNNKICENYDSGLMWV